MRKAERSDLEQVMEVSRETYRLARADLEGIDRKALDPRLDRAITMLTSGVLLTNIDLGDILAGRGRQG